MALKNPTWVQFHQHSTYSFYPRRSQKRKKILMTDWVLTHSGSTRAKAVRRTFMKLTPGLNFINVLRTASTLTDPKSVERYFWLNCIFLRFWDLQAQKLMKLTPGKQKNRRLFAKQITMAEEEIVVVCYMPRWEWYQRLMLQQSSKVLKEIVNFKLSLFTGTCKVKRSDQNA